jgi:predicted Ser/Thr protein kinase
MPEFKPGDVFVNHRIEGLAGRGGMGVVYRAKDLDLDRIVALKVIAPALAEEPDFRARFVAESKAAASIEHPHVIPVYYAGEREGELFIVMRYVDGPDLRALVRAEGHLDPDRVAHIVAQVGGALDAAHAHGLVHRDVKPANVLLGAEDHAYLTDFGLTKREASTGGLSRSGGWVGTLGFVAPEQIRGERVDARTDVYALGCVLVHALTGGAPYIRDSDEATLWAHLHAPPPVERVPEEFVGIVERALSKNPDDRFPSAGDLGRAALAAAGRSAAPGPERLVARGAAAPEGTPQTAATARVHLPPHEGETHISPQDEGGGGGDGRTNVLGDRGRDGGAIAALSRRPLAVGGGALAVAAGALAAFLLAGGNPSTAPTAPTTAAAPPARRFVPATAGKPIGGIRRPNGIAIARKRVFVLSATGEIVVLDAKSGDQQRRLSIEKGGSGVAAGFNSIWALKSNTGALMRLRDRPPFQRVDHTLRIRFPGRPLSLATGQRAVWVGVRKRVGDSRRDGTGELIVRVDPTNLLQEPISIPGGVESVAVGAGAVWVTNKFTNTVTRVDVRDLSRITTFKVGTSPKGVAVDRRAVWVAATADDSITRIDLRTHRRTRIRVGVSPTFVAVGGDSVWATAQDANRLIRIERVPRPGRARRREEIDTGSRPFALDVTKGAVWVTLLQELGDGAVQRIRFHPFP